MTAFVASAQALAGSPAAPPSPVLVVLIPTVLALGFGALAAVAWARRHHEAPLRTEIQARPVVTFSASVRAQADTFGMMLAAKGWLNLTVRGDVFEVSHPLPLARFLFGQDYCYRAEDTTVEVSPGLSHDWIEINGQPGSARILIGRRTMNSQIWDALVRAGAHPIGPPPRL
jgi:hypothetical protein